MHSHDDHGYSHKHSHSHGSPAPAHSDAMRKELALLRYMLEHNKQHAGELAQMGLSLERAGFVKASELINDAVQDFNCANEKLKEAIGLITE